MRVVLLPLHVLALTAAALPAAGTARAAPDARATVAVPAVSKVTVVEPPTGDRVLVEAGQRIRSELDAAGLSNRAVTCAGGVGSGGCDATASAAAIALSRQDGLATIRVIASLPDGYELHRLSRVPAAAGGDDPAVLAVRAVELLRDIYLDVPRELVAREQPKPAPPPPPVAVKVADAPSVPSDRKPMRVFLGAAVLGGRRGLGPAVAPVLGVALPLRYGLSLLGTTAGPFARLVGDAATGTATTTQALFALGVRFEIAFGPISPFASVGTGIHYIRAEGTPTQAMNQFPLTSSAFPPLFAVGTGLSVWFRRWLAATAQIESAWVRLDAIGGNRAAREHIHAASQRASASPCTASDYKAAAADRVAARGTLSYSEPLACKGLGTSVPDQCRTTRLSGV
jgi:hypothetical protein